MAKRKIFNHRAREKVRGLLQRGVTAVLVAVMSLSTLLGALAPTAAYAAAGDTITGRATISNGRNTNNPHIGGDLCFTCDVTFEDSGMTLTGYCYEHETLGQGGEMYAPPGAGTYDYVGTRNPDGTYDVIIQSQNATSWWPGHWPYVDGQPVGGAPGAAGVPRQRIHVWNYAPDGTLSIKKVSGDASITDGNGCYELGGAVYGIYSDRSCTREVGRMTTGADGKATSEDLAVGTYYVREIEPSPGYGLDATVYTATVRAGSDTAVNGGSVPEPPLNDPTRINLQKIDSETGEAVAQGAASLGGAEYSFWFFAGDYYTEAEDGSIVDADGGTIMDADGAFVDDEADRTWVVATNDAGVAMLSDTFLIKEKSDELYTFRGITTLPLGTVVVRETKAPEGYLLSDDVFVMQISEQDDEAVRTGDTVVNDGNVYVGDGAGYPNDEVKRGDIELTKVNGLDSGRLAGVPFLMTSATTGESHVIVTDENGAIDTSSAFNPHEEKTNANDAAVTVGDDGSYTVDEDALDDEAGIWFSGYADGGAEPDDDRGALPFDTYVIEELPVAANAGLGLVKFSVTVSRDGYSVDLGTVDDNYVNIGTTATAADGGHVLGVGETVELVDTVEYEGLVPGETYTLEGTVMLKSTGEPLLDSEGEPVSATAEFSPVAISGKQEVVFTLDTTDLAGESLVVFEELYDVDGELVDDHKDIDDEGQTVTVAEPEIGTKATTPDGGKVVPLDHEVELVDTVSYSGLNPGETYTLKGTVMDRETGEPLLVGEGSTGYELMDAGSGEWAPIGTGRVEHEDGSWTEVSVAENGDGTWSVITESGPAGSEEPETSDTAVYEADQVREVELEGEPVTVSMEFTPESSDGEVEATFSFDSVVLAGKTLVVFERVLTAGGDVVASHEDIGDEGQTVTVAQPEIGTELVDETDGDHEAIPSKTTVLVDTVSYSGLTPGREYTVEGTLMDQQTGEPLLVNDKQVTASATFVPNQADGEVEVTFEFDSSAIPSGTNLTAFETLYYDGVEIAAHADIHDMGQTVEITRAPDGTTYDKTGLDATAVATIVGCGLAAIAGLGAYGWRQSRAAREEAGESDATDEE